MSSFTHTADAAGIFCTFWLAEHCFAVPSWTIREVHRAVPLTPVPGTPPTIRGYVNLRGQLYLVLNPDDLLLGRGSQKRPQRDLIVFRHEVGEAFAIEVDVIGDIMPISVEQHHIQIAAQDSSGYQDAKLLPGLVTGHATLATQLVTLLDPRQFPALGMIPEIAT
ncbi:MAG: chemotaxis protein CheW [Methylococcaceae bacterium]|jgi:purine-binding chemotaxis protein CheW